MTCDDETVHPDDSSKNKIDELSFTRDKEEESRKGSHFMMEFSKPVKYKIAQRINKCLFSCEHCLKTFISHGAYSRHCSSAQHIIKKKLKMYGTRKRQRMVKRKQAIQSMINSMAICNEFSDTKDRFPFSHAHMYLKSSEKYLFKDVKKFMKKHVGVRTCDIVRPINVRECVKYITKQDQNSILMNVPLKFTSTVYKAKLYSEQGHKVVNWSDFIPSQICSSERKIFEHLVIYENKKREKEDLSFRCRNIRLLPWQHEVIETVSQEDNERAVFWIEDTVGGTGKSILAQFLVSAENGALFHDMDYRNNAFLYDKENVVIFDLPRSYVPGNLHFLEDLKNGHIMSSEYEPCRKIFDSPTVIVFSNNPPDLTHLSMDRWKLIRLDTTPDLSVRVIRTLGFNDD